MAYNGHLNANEIYSALFNMIISQRVFADNIGDDFLLVNKARVDGSLFGDTKEYISTDVLKSIDWVQDSQEAINLLATHRAPAPKTQVITLDKFRQIAITVDNYMTKRAWMNEGSFGAFNSVLVAWLNDTKKVYDMTIYNAFIGTDVTATGKQTQNLVLGSSLTAEQRAKTIAEKIANIEVDVADVGRFYNDNQFLRSWSKDRIKVVWNADYVNEIRKVDLPQIFHNDGLVEKLTDNVLPARYFGYVVTDANKGNYSANTPAAGKPLDADGNYAYTPGTNNANGIVRTLVEAEVKVSGTTYHIFPGDEIPAGTLIKTTADYANGTMAFGEIYVQALGQGTNDKKIICKMYVELPPYMSAFEVGTSFYNAKNLSTNNYLTFGHNTLAHLENYPAITLTTTAS